MVKSKHTAAGEHPAIAVFYVALSALLAGVWGVAIASGAL